MVLKIEPLIQGGHEKFLIQSCVSFDQHCSSQFLCFINRFLLQLHWLTHIIITILCEPSLRAPVLCSITSSKCFWVVKEKEKPMNKCTLLVCTVIVNCSTDRNITSSNIKSLLSFPRWCTWSYKAILIYCRGPSAEGLRKYDGVRTVQWKWLRTGGGALT